MVLNSWAWRKFYAAQNNTLKFDLIIHKNSNLSTILNKNWSYLLYVGLWFDSRTSEYTPELTRKMSSSISRDISVFNWT